MSEQAQINTVSPATDEQYTWDAVPEAPRKRPKLRRRHRKLKFTLLLLAVVLLAAAGLTVDFQSAVANNAAVPAAELDAIKEMLQRNIDNNRDQKQLNMYFSADEVTTLIAYVSQKALSPQQVTAHWSNGSVNGVASIPLYGAYINIYYSAIPVLKDGKISWDLRNCRIGRLPLPAKIRDLIVKKLDSCCQNNTTFTQIQDAVKKLDVTSDNAIKITLDIDQQPNPVYTEESSQDEKKLEEAIKNLQTPIKQAAEQQAAACKVIVKNEDINTFLAWIITNHWENARQNNEPHLYAVWQNSGLQIYGKYVNEHNVYYNLALHVTPQINNGKFTIKVNSCSISKIALPVQKVEKAIQDQLDSLFCKQGELSELTQMIIAVKALKNGMELVVEPTAASEILNGIF